MDWNKTNTTWNEFAKLKNTELNLKERTIKDVIQSNYFINYDDELAFFSFIGMLTKGTDGNNTDKTSIIVEYKDRLNITNFELESNKQNKNPSEKNITDLLDKFKGTYLSVMGDFIRIDTQKMFSNLEEFNHVHHLIAELKTIVTKT